MYEHETLDVEQNLLALTVIRLSRGFRLTLLEVLMSRWDKATNC